MIMEFIDNLPKWFLVLFSIVLVAAIGVADKVTGDYSMLIFYLVPVFLTSWFVDKKYGLLTVAAAGIARGISNMPPDGFAPFYYSLHYWNTLVDMVFLLLVGLLISYLRQILE